MSTLLQELSESTKSLVGSVRSSVVCVGEGKARPRTGVVYAPGRVVTLAMAAEVGETVPVDGPDGRLEATVRGFDPTSGVAVLDAPSLESPIERMTDAPAVGELAVEVAAPTAGGHEARLSMIRCVGGLTRLPGGRRIDTYFQTDASRFRGFAGAVLVRADGTALGISVPGGRRDESFILPMDQLLTIVERVESGEAIGSAFLGVKTSPVELPKPVEGHTHGLIVTGVEAESPAARAGLLVGDFLIAIDGDALHEVDSLYDALQGRTRGSTMEVTLVSAASVLETRTVEVELRS